MNKFKISTLIGCLATVVFSFSCISFHADISVLAFPLCIIFNAILYYFLYIYFVKDSDCKGIPVIRKMYQYQAFVLLIAFVIRRAGKYEMPKWVDIISVSFWIISALVSVYNQYILDEKRVYSLNKNWKKVVAKKRTPIERILFEIVDWVDALVQAVFLVLIFQIFFFQLYEIPSESMVPEFLIKDRVMVGKIVSGPKFPLSDIGLPCFENYKRGDIVVFRNPHYSMDRKSEVKSVVSQLVYMLTFTTVNLNVDDRGQPKADPLVKRIAGVPGEQLVMLDGVLYSRKEGDTDFTPIKEDEKWASYALFNERPEIRQKIREYPINKDLFDNLLACEQMRNNLNIEQTKLEAKALANEFLSIFGKKITSVESHDFISEKDMWELTLFRSNEAIAKEVLLTDEGANWFYNFMTSWISSAPKPETLYGGDMYSDANYRLNLMIKMTLGRLIVRNVQLIKSDAPKNEWANDSELINYMNQAEMVHNYINYLDRRNMPVFPANKDGNAIYLPKDCYFMMGDNRFNSLDMRHSYEEKLVPLTLGDEYSVRYYSNMNPQYVSKKRILGSPSFRFWPLSRIGIPGSTR